MDRRDVSSTVMPPMPVGTFGDPFAGRGSSMERREPKRAMTAESEVVVPLMQALFTGMLSVALIADLVFVPWPWIALGGLFLLVVLGLWVWLIIDGRRMLWSEERSREGALAAPEPVPPERFEIVIQQKTPAGHSTVWLDIPGKPAAFAQFARAAISGMPISEAAWIGAGNPYSKAQFGALRDTLLQRALLEWVNPDAHNQGLQPTRAGRVVLQAWLDQWDGQAEK